VRHLTHIHGQRGRFFNNAQSFEQQAIPNQGLLRERHDWSQIIVLHSIKSDREETTETA